MLPEDPEPQALEPTPEMLRSKCLTLNAKRCTGPDAVAALPEALPARPRRPVPDHDQEHGIITPQLAG